MSGWYCTGAQEVSEVTVNYRNRGLRARADGWPNCGQRDNPANFPQVSPAVSRARLAGDESNSLTGQLTEVNQ